MRRIIRATFAGALALTLLSACADEPSGSGASDTADSSTSTGLTGTVTVLAAASLTDTFTAIGTEFEKDNPGVKVTFSFGGSSALAEQANQGAPADVFASASVKNMTLVTDAGNADEPTNFAKNVMQIAVPPGNPAKIASIGDLAKPGVKVALCQAEVPCGATALKVFENAGIDVTAVTLEEDVKSTLTKVQLVEVDAAVVYVTDVKAAGDKVEGIDIAEDVNASTEYPIATLKNAPNAEGAKAFMEYVLSEAGQKVLQEAGFLQA